MAQRGIYRTGRHAQGAGFRSGPHRLRSHHSGSAWVCEPDFAERQSEDPHSHQVEGAGPHIRFLLHRTSPDEAAPTERNLGTRSPGFLVCFSEMTTMASVSLLSRIPTNIVH